MIVAVVIISLVNGIYGQDQKCDSLSNELLDVDPSFKNELGIKFRSLKETMEDSFQVLTNNQLI